MTKKLSYMLYSGKIADDVYTLVPGLFQWAVAFDKFGRGGTLDDNIAKFNLENYDIIHVNYTPMNASYIAAIRNELGWQSDTKIIANVDYATGMWNGMDPYIAKSMLENADMVFHVEPNGAQKIQRLMGGDWNVHTIPHPVNTVEIQQYAKEDRSPMITCQYHRYLDSWQDYWWGLKEIREKYKDFMVILMNYTPPNNIAKRGSVPIVSMFDKVIARAKYAEYLKVLAEARINIDVTPDYTYGRGIVDAAALGVPTIGSGTISAAHRLFPTSIVKAGNDGMMKTKCEELLNSDEFYDCVVKYGMENCHYYSLENSHNRMVEAICESC